MSLFFSSLFFSLSFFFLMSPRGLRSIKIKLEKAKKITYLKIYNIILNILHLKGNKGTFGLPVSAQVQER